MKVVKLIWYVATTAMWLCLMLWGLWWLVCATNSEARSLRDQVRQNRAAREAAQQIEAAGGNPAVVTNRISAIFRKPVQITEKQKAEIARRQAEAQAYWKARNEWLKSLDGERKEELEAHKQAILEGYQKSYQEEVKQLEAIYGWHEPDKTTNER